MLKRWCLSRLAKNSRSYSYLKKKNAQLKPPITDRYLYYVNSLHCFDVESIHCFDE